MRPWRAILTVIALLAPVSTGVGRDSPHIRTFPARDSLAIEPDANPDAQQMLADLAWPPRSFSVTCTATRQGGGQDVLVTFDAPKPRGEPAEDRVVIEWYVARDGQHNPIDAPAVLVLHTLHPQMPIGRAIARGLSQRGHHAFVMQLPGYGLRRGGPWLGDGRFFFPRMQQAITDARRARDAIAALPHIKSEPIAIIGMSLGGFVAASAASLDGAFNPVMIVLAGGDLDRVIREGQADVAIVRQRLEEAGIRGELLRLSTQRVEPLRIAHRLDPARTWLYSAIDDTVVPPASSDALAARIGLPDHHHLRLQANHYTAGFLLPALVEDLARKLQGDHEN